MPYAEPVDSFADMEEEFLERVHVIARCTAATVDTRGRPQRDRPKATAESVPTSRRSEAGVPTSDSRRLERADKRRPQAEAC